MIQAKCVIDYFEKTIMSAYIVREAFMTGHRMVYNWPRVMFAELATNCILHKKYDRKQYIGIYVCGTATEYGLSGCNKKGVVES